MKWALIIVNVAAAVALYVLGSMAVAAHRTHAFSVYRELQTQHVLVERPDYDIEKRIASMAAGGGYYLVLSRFGVVVCLTNAVLVGFIGSKSKTDAGLVCSCSMVLFIVSLLGYRLFSADITPRWLGIVSGTTILAAFISGAVCITTAVFGRFKPSSQITDHHEKSDRIENK